jgi:hypothetical protein
VSSAIASKTALLLTLALPLSGCLTRELKELDIEQRHAELSEINDAATFLRAKPTLAAEYDARLFVSETALNEFLAGLDGYTIPLDSPRKASIVLTQTRLTFVDGTSLVSVEAVGLRQGWPVRVKLRVLAQLVVAAHPENGTLDFGFRIKRVLPDIKISIFRLREWLFAQSLMRVPAQKYVNTLPSLKVELSPQFNVAVNSQNDTWVDTGDTGRIKLRVSNPSLNRSYRYVPLKVIPLDDGLHLLLKMESAI